MKHTLETMIISGGILLLRFLSRLLLPAAQLGLELSRQIQAQLHVQDQNQLYTFVFCWRFLILGTNKYFVIRFIWRRWSKT